MNNSTNSFVKNYSRKINSTHTFKKKHTSKCNKGVEYVNLESHDSCSQNNSLEHTTALLLWNAKFD